MDSNALVFQRRADRGGGRAMPDHQVMHPVGAEARATGVREQHLAVPPRRFAEPGVQHDDRGFGQRGAPFLAALADHPDMRPRPEDDIGTGESGHFGQPEPRLHRHQEKRVIAPPEPGARIGGREQRVDFRAGERVHQGPREALAGDGQHPVDLRGMSRRLEGGVPKEGVERGQSEIPAARAEPALPLEMLEKRPDQRGIDGRKGQARGRRLQPLVRKRQEQPEGVAIRTNRMRTHLPLLHQALGEEPLQQRSQADTRGRHGCPSQRRSRRDIASCIRAGQALRYQNVSRTCTWPR
jgi:hypothetical protein